MIKVRYNYSRARPRNRIAGLISAQKGWDSIWMDWRDGRMAGAAQESYVPSWRRWVSP